MENIEDKSHVDIEHGEYRQAGQGDSDDRGLRAHDSGKNSMESCCSSCKAENKDCRICQMKFDQESGCPIQLGCACKNDLAVAHKHCAEAWFEIKGNKTCEICGSIAQNVDGPILGMVVMTEASDVSLAILPAEHPGFLQRHRRCAFANVFVTCCLVFAFAFYWLLPFNVHRNDAR